jgi:hypothetical protein
MKPVEKQIKRPPGRPRTGITPPLSTRVPQEVLDRIDQWAADNDCTRSVATAKLIEHGLNATQKAAGRRAKRRGAR